MKGILLNSTTLAGKKYVYNDITKGITASCFPVDKFYGGRVTRFGKTAKGLLLCLEKNYEEVIDIFVDLDTLEGLDLRMLQDIAAVVKRRKLLNTPGDKKDAAEKALEIPRDATKKELVAYIRKYALDVISNEPYNPVVPEETEAPKVPKTPEKPEDEDSDEDDDPDEDAKEE